MAWLLSRRNRLSFLTANTVAGPLDRAHRSGRATGNHQDPPAALLLPRRTHHPQGPLPLTLHFPKAGPGKPSSCRPWPGCEPCRSLPDGGASNRPVIPFLRSLKRLPSSRQMAQRVSHAASHSSSNGSSGLTLAGPLPTTRPIYPYPPQRSLLHHPRVPFQCSHNALRWIRAKRRFGGVAASLLGGSCRHRRRQNDC